MIVKISNQYRPQTLLEIKGQDHIKRSIQRSVANKSISSCYLFHGQHGTGKTTMARLFAKLTICENLINNDCCNTCAKCVATKNKSFLNIIEIDAASNRGVEDISKIKEDAYTIFSNAGKTFFIIDEAHMISDHGFNAMLKILEEPPVNVVFILVTTEKNKIPNSICSRCISLAFHPISHNLISDKLQAIIGSLDIAVSQDIVDIISENSYGSMRDAESILEASLFGREKDDTLSEADVINTLGVLDIKKIKKIDEFKEKCDIDSVSLWIRSIIKDFNYPIKILEAFANHWKYHLLSKLQKNSLIPSYVRSLYDTSIYEIEEIKNILTGILALETSTKRSDLFFETWMIIHVYKIISGDYKINYIKSLKNFKNSDINLNENKCNVLKNSENTLKSVNNNKKTQQQIKGLIEFIRVETT